MLTLSVVFNKSIAECTQSTSRSTQPTMAIEHYPRGLTISTSNGQLIAEWHEEVLDDIDCDGGHGRLQGM